MHPLSLRLLFLGLTLLVAKAGFGQTPPDANGPGPDGLKVFFSLRAEPLNQSKVSGLPANAMPPVLNWQAAYRLALIRSREAKPLRVERLDDERVAEAARNHEADVFAKFENDFLTNASFRDPSADLLDLQARLLSIENAHWNQAYLDRWETLLKELILGESSGLGKAELDHFDELNHEARRRQAHLIADYRDRLDAFKVSLGLSTHSPLILDLVPLEPFHESFEALNRWFIDPNRQLEGLATLAQKLPSIGEVVVEGRSILDEMERAPDQLEEVLALATRIALKNKLGEEDDDAIELRVRRRLRHLVELRIDYALERRRTVMAARMLQDAFEQEIAPPNEPGNPSPGKLGKDVMKIWEHSLKIFEIRNQLVSLWTNFHAERIALYRDLGVLPYEDWASFYGQFTAVASKPDEPSINQPDAPIPATAPPLAPSVKP
ncbi:hypothetical protein [Singulisphaera sp. PoT]|uniref:hypothetical protein n=1 Tax=Singulisphaera sp. PoT TaxID=3411797 RepID=UPI003BF51E76